MSEVIAMSWMATAKQLIKGNDGIASAEFVFILPVLTVLLLGPIEIGRLQYQFQIASDGVYDAARYLAVHPVDCSSGPGPGTFVDAGDQTEAQNLAMTGTISSPADNSDYLIPAWNNAGTTFASTVDCADNTVLALEGLYTGCGVVPTVTVTVNLRFNFLSALPYLPLYMDLPISHSQVNSAADTFTLSC